MVPGLRRDREPGAALPSPAVLLPPALRPGDPIAVFAGSSPFDHTLALRGLSWLAARYRVTFDRSMFQRQGFLAGSDERRERELNTYLADPRFKALVAVRGGYGLSRFAHGLDWSLLARHPRWIVGFSDVTAIHVEAWRVGVASIHGPMVAALGRSDGWTRRRFVAALEEPAGPWGLAGLETIAPGRACGRLVGGNLTLVHACAAAGRLVLPAGCLLLLEDVTERPYRIDRMLATLEVGGHLARVGGVVLGGFTDCLPGPDRVTVDQVLRERLGRLGVPVVGGAPIGHDLRNAPIVLGREYVVDADRGSLEAA